MRPGGLFLNMSLILMILSPCQATDTVQYPLVSQKIVISEYSPEGRWFKPTWCFWRCRCRIRRIRSSVNLRQLCRTQRRAERRAARPGTARYGTASSTPSPVFTLCWRNTRSELLRPILFCIFGMCSSGVNQRPQFGQCRDVCAGGNLFPNNQQL